MISNNSKSLEKEILMGRKYPTILEVDLNKGERVTQKMKNLLLKHLNDEVVHRFGGNKALAARAVGLSRPRFTEICNGSERVSMEKLIEIAVLLGWDVKLLVQRECD